LSARTAIIRAELALAALAATALLLATIVMVDALRFHLPLLVSGDARERKPEATPSSLLVAPCGVDRREMSVERSRGELGDGCYIVQESNQS